MIPSIKLTAFWHILATWLLMAAFSCSKPEQQTGTPPVSPPSPTDTVPATGPSPLPPELSEKVSCSVSGTVVGLIGAPGPLENATVRFGDKTTTTDEFGFFEIRDALVRKGGALVTVSKENYITTYRTVLAEAGGAPFVRFKVHFGFHTRSFSAASGGSYAFADGGTITFAPYSFTSGGQLYQGDVSVLGIRFDKNDNNLGYLHAGDNRGLDTLARWKTLSSLGLVSVTAKGAGGEPLEFRSEATLSIPIFGSTNPDSVSLWNLDDTLGIWRQTGLAVKEGFTYRTKINRLGELNFATAVNSVVITGRILTAAGEPVSYAYLQATNPAPGPPAPALFQYTGTDGRFAFAVPAESVLSLDVSGGYCTQTLLRKTFSSGKENLALGDIRLPADQTVQVTGTLLACNSTPVSGGQLFMYFEQDIHPSRTGTDGRFRFNTAVCSFSPYTTAMFIAREPATGQKSDRVYKTFVPGLNPLGDVSVCGTSEEVWLDASFVDNTGTPLADAFVELEPKRAGGEPYTVRTDSAGKIYTFMYQNTNYTLRVFGSSGCATPAFTTGFQTVNVNLSLGKQTVTNLVRSTVTGRLVDCNNLPVSSGQVILYREGRSTRVLANSAGVFSFHLPACNSGSPQTIQLTGQDNSLLQTGAPVTLSVQAGANNVGNVGTCHTQPSAQEFINYSVDNDYFSLQSPVDTLFHSIQPGSNWHSFGAASRTHSDLYIYFTCYQNAGLGTKNPGLDEFGIGPDYGRYVPTGTDSVAVTYTEFGPVGGFIAGHFTVPVIHSSIRSVHTVRVKFRIRRRL